MEKGEHYGTQFSLKIDFSEFDALAEDVKKSFRELLPVNLEQVAKEKLSLLGIHEKSFMMGTREMIQLAEGNKAPTKSYVPKDRSVFIAKQTEETIVVSLPFEVTGAVEMFDAGLYEYTQGVNLMSLHIVDDETHEEVAISAQGKYLSVLSGVFLPEGRYYLVVKNDRAAGIGATSQAPLEFVLDVVRHQLPETH